MSITSCLRVSLSASVSTDNEHREKRLSVDWWQPDLFRRVLSYSGTFVSQITDPTPIAHGCSAYHDVDPHFVEMTEAPRGLIVYSDFDIANQRLAAALKLRGYQE